MLSNIRNPLILIAIFGNYHSFNLFLYYNYGYEIVLYNFCQPETDWKQ